MKTKDIIIEAVRARIDHPEDWVWRNGNDGYNAAISAIEYAQQNPNQITIKYDGTPALIFGRDDNGSLVITDKSGFGAKKYNGHPTNQKDLYQMLYSRKPTQEGRHEYATTIAALWPLLEQAVPKTTRGYYQGDLMYVGTPKIQDNFFIFKPNKIEYKIPTNSDIGKKVSASKAGIVVHSYFKNATQEVPDPISDISELQQYSQLFVMSPTMYDTNIDVASTPNNDFSIIDNILNPLSLREKKISDFPLLVGKFINYNAMQGTPIDKSAPVEFLNWLPLSKITVEKQDRLKIYIKENMESYVNLWKAILVITNFKNMVKQNLDNKENSQIIATLNGEPNHEGYVVSTPSGKIKIVDRYKFMAKQKV